MANNLYDTGKPQKIIVEHVHEHPSHVSFVRELVEAMLSKPGPRRHDPSIIDAEFEVIEEPKRKQLK